MIFYLNQKQFIDTSKPLDISMSLRAASDNPRAWYVDAPRIEPVRANGFVGSVLEGGAVNFRDIYFNPHGHGTHTESYGHISEQIYSVNEVFDRYFFKASLLSVEPRVLDNGDRVIFADQLAPLLNSEFTEAVVIRTLPNYQTKLSANYSGTNPCYFDVGVVALLDQLQTKHFLVDTPSVDREEDNGELAFHHAFWNVPAAPIKDRSITELIFVADEIADGGYLLELQLAHFQNDASPSRPLLYAINEKKGLMNQPFSSSRQNCLSGTL
jgi:arylformamidase